MQIFKSTTTTRIPIVVPTTRPLAVIATPWLPYAIAGTVGACFLILFLFCFWKPIKTILYYLCCCCLCSQTQSATREQEFTSSVLPESVAPIPRHRSDSNSVDGVSTRPPAIPISTAPYRHQAAPSYRTQYVSGNIPPAASRRPGPPRNFAPSPNFAPAAAKQVAQTTKIICDILTYDGSRAKKK